MLHWQNEPFDVDSFGQYYRPYTSNNENNNTVSRSGSSCNQKRKNRNSIFWKNQSTRCNSSVFVTRRIVEINVQWVKIPTFLKVFKKQWIWLNFLKNIQKTNIKTGFYDLEIWIDTGAYVLNKIISGSFRKGIQGLKVK